MALHQIRLCGFALVAVSMSFATSVAIPGLLLAATPEAVVLPYRCSVERGQVRLQRAPARSLRVLGVRDQQTINYCFGPRSGGCRPLVLYRFVLDCAGTPLAWVQAAGAINGGQPWQATVSSGRMTLHRPASSPQRDRPTALVLPTGFAPAPPSGMHFVRLDGAATAESHSKLGTQGTAASVTPLRSQPGDRREATDSRATGARDLSGNALPQTAERSDAMPSFDGPASDASHVGLGWTATVTAINEDRSAYRWPTFAANSQSAILAAVTLVALLLSAMAVAARHRLHDRARAAGNSPETGNDAGAPMPKVPPPLPAPSEPTASAQPPPPPPVIRSSPTTPPIPNPADPETAAWAEIAELKATAEALLDLDRQIVADHVPEGALRDVLVSDLAAIADRLAGPELAEAGRNGRPDVMQPIYTQAIVDLERARTLARIEHERMLVASGEAGRPLATADEAYSFLGVNPRAGEAVVKKAVDALRQNWHPDLAGDDADRQAREVRIKHINAAWDLIRAR